MINSNWHPISYRFGVIAAYCSNFAPTRLLWLKISGRRGRPPPKIFALIVRPMNALQLCPWRFSHRCYGWGATSKNRSKIGDFTPTRSLWSKISATRGRPPTNHSSSQKTRINILSYGINIWTDLSSVLSGITRVTDERTDGQTDGQTEFYSLYRVCITCSAVKKRRKQ